MREIIKKKIKSISSNGMITYQIECDVCKKNFSGKPVMVAEALKDISEDQQTVQTAMIEKSKDRELVSFVKKTTETFSLCPICHKLVCDDCFLVCDELDMCIECASRLQKKGKVVADL